MAATSPMNTPAPLARPLAGRILPLIGVVSLASIPMGIGASLLTRNWTFEYLGTVPAQKFKP